MTPTPPSARPLRPSAEYRWTNRKARAAARQSDGFALARRHFGKRKVTVLPAKVTVSGRKVTVLPPKVTVLREIALHSVTGVKAAIQAGLRASANRGRHALRIVLALCLILSSAALAAQPAHAQAACDRECLRGKVTEVLYAFAGHDAGKLAVAGNLRVTEDGVEKPLAQVGLVRSLTRLRGWREDVIDERTQQVVTSAMVEESGAPVMLVVRIKVDGEQRLSELELVATRSRADGLLFNVDGLSGAPPLAMTLAPPPSQLATRDEAVRIAMFYPRGLSEAKTFNAIETPFAPEAYRHENGALMAGPGCTFAPGCDSIGNQSLAIFERLGRVTVRDIVVDERMGIVMLRLSWNVSGPGSARLTAWEGFKVYGGHIHMVQAFIRIFPPELDLGGWPVAAGIVQP